MELWIEILQNIVDISVRLYADWCTYTPEALFGNYNVSEVKIYHDKLFVRTPDYPKSRGIPLSELQFEALSLLGLFPIGGWKRG